MVLRSLRRAAQKSGSAMSNDPDKITLDLHVGQVPVDFHREDSGNIFGEMHQVDPVFGPVHDRDDISADAPIESLSTGLHFIIVPIKNLATLQRLMFAPMHPRARHRCSTQSV